MASDALFTRGGPGGPGRPKGCRNKDTHWAIELHSAHGAEAAQKIAERMKADDPDASAFIVRHGPRAHDESLVLDLPQVRSAEDVVEASNEIVQEMGRGELTIGRADKAMRVLERQMRIVAVAKLQKEVEELREVAADFVKMKQLFEEASRK
ncbi:MAG: hypothetical protein KIT25_06390 [Enhydrobacter sp.]|nr:MAG: hypothetical protein KIT25_06390 [Enhydrobacter sp.]